MKGVHLTRVETEQRYVEVDVLFNQKTLPALRQAVRQFAGFINTEVPKKMVFLDEPELHYFGILSGQTPLEEIVSYGKSTLTFLLPDPIAWGKEMIQSLTIQSVSIDFSRASKALTPYFENSENFEVPVDAPRYGNGLFGKCLLLEEATTNLIPDPQGLSGYSFKSYTLSERDSSIVNGVASVKFSRTGGTGDIRLLSPVMQVSKTTSHVYSYDLKRVSGYSELRAEGTAVSDAPSSRKDIGRLDQDGTFTGVNGCTMVGYKPWNDGYIRVSILLPATFFSKGTGVETIIVHSNGFTQNGDHEYQLKNPQVESNKIRSTNFAVGERKEESLKLPITFNVTGNAGTWEHRFWIDENLYGLTDSVERFIWAINDLAGNNAISLGVKFGQFRVSIKDTPYNISLKDKWNEVSVSWTNTSLIVIVNGVLVHNVTGLNNRLEFSGSSLLGTNGYSPQSNVWHDAMRLSAIARSSASLIASHGKAWNLDGSTTLLMNFNDNLEWESNGYEEDKTIYVGGTTSTSPIFSFKSLGEANEFKVTLDKQDFLRVVKEIKTNDIIVMDCNKNLLTVNGRRSMEFLDIDSKFFDLKVGQNTLNLTEGLNAEVTVSYSERWN